MPHTPVLLHDHNEFINGRIFLDGIGTFVTLITALANVGADEVTAVGGRKAAFTQAAM